MTTVKKSKRIFYFDALRALAIFSVIMIHVFSKSGGLIINEYSLHPSFEWLLSCFCLQFFRIGVPIFLMLSGALSLGREWEIESFLAKRIPRIVAPFLFWSIILSLLAIYMSYLFNFNWVESYGWYSILNFIYNTIMFFNTPSFYPYWFFWMILGTYLIMPVFNKWLLHSDLKEAEYFLCIWLITCLFSYTLSTPFPVKLRYFTSPIGLVVLGYYLRHTERKFLNNPYLSILYVIIPVVLMVYFSYLNSSLEEIYHFNRYSILVAIEVVGIFTLFKNANKLNVNFRILNNPNGILRKFIYSLAKYSYGMYLIHNSIIVIVFKFIHDIPMGYISLDIVLILASVFGSLAVLAILNRIPYINQVIGVK